jgi:hypothetical protein
MEVIPVKTLKINESDFSDEEKQSQLVVMSKS